MSKKTETVFSPRSAASQRREAELLAQLGKVEKQLGIARSSLAGVQRTRDRQREAIPSGGADTLVLDACLRECEDLERRIAVLDEVKAEVLAHLEIERAIAPDRAGVQAAVAQVARRRLEHRVRIEGQLGELRTSLSKDAEFTRELAGLAERIEFEGDLDGDRYADTLAGSQPHLPGAQCWHGQSFGSEAPGLVRCVARLAFELSETLRYSGRTQPGDELLLTESQFSELSQSSYTTPGGTLDRDKLRDYFVPRRVVSAEQAEQDRAGAGERSLEDYWRSQDQCEFTAAEAARALEHERRVWDGDVESFRGQHGIPMGDARRRFERQYGARP